MYKLLVFLLMLNLCSEVSIAQQDERNTLRVPSMTTDKVKNLIDTLNLSTNAKDRVNLMNKIAALYWRKGEVLPKNFDSCVIYASQAKQLGNRIKFEYGTDQAIFLLCKGLLDAGAYQKAELVAAEASSAQAARLQLVLGEFFLYQPGASKVKLRKAQQHLLKGLSFAKANKSLHWTEETEISLGKYHFLIGEVGAGTQYFKSVIDYYHQKKDLVSEAHWWSDLGHYLPIGEANDTKALAYQKKAMYLYQQAGDKDNMAQIADWIGETYRDRVVKLDSAQIYFSLAISLRKAAGGKKLYKYYYHLAETFLSQDNFKEALAYALASIKNMDELKAIDNRARVFVDLGEIYTGLNDYENGLRYYKEAMKPALNSDVFVLHYLIKKISDNLILQHQPKVALAYLEDFAKSHPPRDDSDRATLASARGNCYAALRKVQIAEKYYQAMIRYSQSVDEQHLMFYSKSIVGVEAYYTIADFYVRQNRFKAALPYLNKYDEMDMSYPKIAKNVALLKFKIDSTAGNLLSALKNYQLYTSYKDTIYNIANAGKLAEMRIRYQTEQTEKDNKLLNNAVQLNERKISQTAQSRNFSYFSVVMLAVVMGIGFNRYRIKQYGFKQLQTKQLEINSKNDALQVLNQELQGLIVEKEWLVQEIHHRVKNNLQMMQSLLESQSHYSNGEDVVFAIETSKRRMQAMSLIHQRLYLTKGSDQIVMSEYIHELVGYLKGSFDSDQRINYFLKIDHLEMDPQKAIPLGLIINECVTNAIKYAFPGEAKGVIKISLLHSENQITLTIHDNGVGLPNDISWQGNNSFGFILITGLVNQLNGKINIEYENGLKIVATFIFDVYQPNIYVS
jgi:two-component sensor histidine kinase